MSSSLRVILLALILFAIALPAAAQVFPKQLVPCDGPTCNACDLVVLAQTVLNTLIALGVFIGVLLFTYAGFLYVTSGGSHEAHHHATAIFKDVAIGFILALSAWLVVNLIMNTFLDTSTGIASTWNQIQCGDDKRPNSKMIQGQLPPLPQGGIGKPVGTSQNTTQQNASTNGTQSVVNVNGVATATGCSTGCVNIAQGIPIKQGACTGVAVCAVDTALSRKMLGFVDNMTAVGLSTSEWQITEAYPPTMVHQNQCHSRGTCVDINYTNNSAPTGTEIAAVQNAAASSGLRAVYEVQTNAQKNALVAGGAHANDIQVVSAITAPHFSVYNIALAN